MTAKGSDNKVGCEHCGKTTARTEDERRRLVNRLNRIEGQIRGIRGMIERDAYCNDILIQSSAVSAALNAFDRDLIANLKNGDDSVVDELVATLERFMK